MMTHHEPSRLAAHWIRWHHRCWWCGDDPLYVRYHDEEWGHETTSDKRLYEKLCLEGFQSGLAWITILRKRENFRAAFADFDIPTVAAFDEADVQRLLGDAGIVRHRGKIASTINNAACAQELIADCGSIHAYALRYRPEAARARLANTPDLQLQATTPESVAMSKDLKKRGWTFVGPTTLYAFMQSTGLVNDHIDGCERAPE